MGGIVLEMQEEKRKKLEQRRWGRRRRRRRKVAGITLEKQEEIREDNDRMSTRSGKVEGVVLERYKGIGGGENKKS